LTIALGLASRRLRFGLPWWDKSLGDALYAVAVYLVLALVFPQWSIRRTGAGALLFCAAIELFQWTGIPAAYARLAVVRWLIGTQFALHDLLCYLVGVLAIASLDSLWRRRTIAYT
jgi:hypothetical protein